MIRPIAVLLAAFLPAFAAAQASDSTTAFVVDSIEVYVLNAFDDAKAHSSGERMAFGILNNLRFETRESVVRSNITFDKNERIDSASMLECERRLRNLPYLADAKVERRSDITAHGKLINIVKVTTSDKWTTSVPVSIGRPDGTAWEWSIGVLENNFLGYGKALGFFYSTTQIRDSRFLFYEDNQFLIANQRMAGTYSWNSDGWNHTFNLSRGLWTRSKPLWLYSVDANTRLYDKTVYFGNNQEVPGVSIPTLAAPNARTLEHGQPEVLALIRGIRTDSLLLRFGRAFPGYIHTQVRGNLDFTRTWTTDPPLTRTWLADGAPVIVDPEWDGLDMPRFVEARPGMTLTASRIRYSRLKNYRRVKWTEDVDRGWSLSTALSRNQEAWGATDRGWRIAASQFAATTPWSGHHITLDGNGYTWLDGERGGESYQRLRAEYVWQLQSPFSLMLAGSADQIRNGRITDQLSLGGLQGMYGLPAYTLVGDARTLGETEVRWFPSFELGTMIPVFAGFVNAGGTDRNLWDIGSEDVIYSAGMGMRISMSKSVQGVVNHFNLSWPLNGPLADGIGGVRFSLLAKTSL